MTSNRKLWWTLVISGTCPHSVRMTRANEALKIADTILISQVAATHKIAFFTHSESLSVRSQGSSGVSEITNTVSIEFLKPTPSSMEQFQQEIYNLVNTDLRNTHFSILWK